MKDVTLFSFSSVEVFSYASFIHWVEELAAEGKTSGFTQDEVLAHFTALNLKRMQRIYKTTPLNDMLVQAINSLESVQHWYIITEAWCGDSAQNLPVIARIAEAASGKIQLHIILRDENPAWMEKYHSNGSRSVPKLIAFDEHQKELFTWGPRPKEAQQMLLDWKQNPGGRSWNDFEKELDTWYAKDRSGSLQQELFHLIRPFMDGEKEADAAA